jgi:hypothetical protein
MIELRTESDGNPVSEFCCAETTNLKPSMQHFCIPGPDSRYLTCQTHECPEGYSPLALHMEDTETGRVGFAFSCVPHERRQAEPVVMGSAYIG